MYVPVTSSNLVGPYVAHTCWLAIFITLINRFCVCVWCLYMSICRCLFVCLCPCACALYRTILLSVISLLNEPNISSPANVDASVMYRKYRDGKSMEYRDIVK